jgi:hypothetical protein
MVPRPWRAKEGWVKMARMLARSVVELRLASMRRVEGALEPP